VNSFSPRTILKSGLFQNIIALYGVQGVGYLLPLIVVPYLIHTLRPEGWGILAFVQGFCAFMNILIEYGFDMSATREVARVPNDTQKLSNLLASVLGAKACFAVLATFVTFLAYLTIPALHAHPLLLGAGLFGSVMQSLNLLWFFQGLERMRFVSVLEITTKVVCTLGIFFVVHQPEDAWKVLVMQGVASTVTLGLALRAAYRTVPVTLPTLALVTDVLRQGWGMFMFKCSDSLFTAGNAFILGLFVSPVYVGYYAGAEKLFKASTNLLYPLSRGLYPRLSFLADRDRPQAKQLIRLSTLLMGLGGSGIAGLFIYAAPWIIGLVLGPAMVAEATPTFQILMLGLPLIGLHFALGLQWMMCLGLERAYSGIVLAAGLLNCTLAFFLAPRFAHIGMAWSIVLTEVFLIGMIVVVLTYLNKNPFTAETAT
jgi:polysaccharide transporter, PST family